MSFEVLNRRLMKVIRDTDRTHAGLFRIWERARLQKEEHEQGGERWPACLYLSTDAVYDKIRSIASALLEGGFDTEDAAEQAFNVSARTATLSAWCATKGVYVLDSAISRDVLSSSLRGELPVDLLCGLPEWSVYVILPDKLNVVCDAEGGYTGSMGGFFASVVGSAGNLSLALLPDLGGDVFTTLQVFLLPLRSGYNLSDLELNPVRGGIAEERADEARVSVRAMIKVCLNALLFISSQLDDIRGPHDTRPQRVLRTKKRRRKPPLIIKPRKSTKWEVGWRMGSQLRAARARREGAGAVTEGLTPKPHVRRAHWHAYWTGPKALPKKRKLILKWLHPILVGDHTQDMPMVVHPVPAPEVSP